MANKILTGLREWMRHDRKEKKRGEFVPRWPHASTFLNQERYSLEDIPLSTDKPKLIEVSRCQCGEPAAYKNLCEDCYEEKHPDPWKKERTAELIRLGLAKPGQSKGEVIAACRSHLLKTGLLARTLGGRAQ